MKYQLIKPVNLKYSAIEQILTNRGIKHEDIKHYLNTTDNDIYSPLELGEKVLKEGVAVLLKAIYNNTKTLIIVDSDCDGFTSSAVLINFLYDHFPRYTLSKVEWLVHSGKQHGLKDCKDIILEKDYSLVICPDSSSNNFEEHKMLNEKGIDVLVLDHHKADHISENAIVINNQLSDYPNKQLSGVGIVWQFCRYIDLIMKTNYAEDYVDLVALGLMADMMSMTSFETRHLITKGFKNENIQNPFIVYIADRNSYSLGKNITPMGAAFYIAPFVNAITRSGTLEEKHIVFKSMLKFEASKKIPSTKRGHKEGEEEPLVLQAIRTAINVKNRQTKAQDVGMTLLEDKIEKKHLLDHKVLLFLLKPGEINSNIAGLIANKFMSKYQRPCCILTQVEDENKIFYQGSARGYEKGGVADFKKLCESAPGVEFAEGHPNAFGLSLYLGQKDYDEEVWGESILLFLDYTDEVLKFMSSEPIYLVDYIYEGNQVKAENIIDIASLDYLWGKDMDESLVAVKGLKITKDMITLMSPDKKPTLKITLPNNISLIKFNSSQEEYEKLFPEDGYIAIDLVGKCNKNEWQGYVNPQIFIEDYEIVDSSQYYF